MLGTRQRYSASTVDQMPRHVAAGYVFGTPVAVPVPDLDRTDFLVVLGANPYASNGSLCTAPDFPGRIEAMQARGGRLVVVDPRRSRTAEQADEWLPIRPGSDALLLAAIANTLFDEGLADPGPHVAAHLAGLDDVRAGVAPFTPEAVEAATGIDAATIRRLARELAAAPTAAVYGRIGTTTTEFGSTASWLIDVVNVLTGNLDRAGGAMFSMPVAGGPSTRGAPGSGPGFRIGRGHSRVSGHPEVAGEYPVAVLAEEILTPGAGQVRSVVTVGGNPMLSTPNANQLADAFADLEFMVSIDMYLNETTKYADVVLPVPSQLERSHYDLLLLQFAVRNVANYSDAVLPLEPGVPDEWEVIAKLALIAEGLGVDADVSIVDDHAVAALGAQCRWRSIVSGQRPRCRRARRRGLCGRSPRPGADARSDAALRPVRRGLRGRSRLARHSTRWWPTHTVWTTARSSRVCPRSSARRPARSSSARRSSSAISSGWRPRSASSLIASSCSSVVGIFAATTRGCTTSTCWSRASHGAPCRSIPTTPRDSD